MSYLVLARKWRPQLFEDVVGQEHVTRTLSNAIEHERVAHAYLFTGTRGVGKTTTARILAKALNCLSGPTPTPCNTCGMCSAVIGGSAIDVIEIDGASNRTVEEIQNLLEKVRYTPAQARTKVYIIDEVHMLSPHAFNALLKTLEEPPPSTVFIFATTEVHKIPATIVSRCQRFDFHPVEPGAIVEQLQRIVESEKVSMDDGSLWLVARAAQGSMRDALSLLDQLLSHGQEAIDEDAVRATLGVVGREALTNTFAALCAHDTAGVLAELHAASQQGYDMAQFCRSLLEHVRDHLIVKAAADPRGLVHLPDQEIDELRRLGANVSIEDLQQYFQMLYQAEEQMRWAPNARLVLELALVKISRLTPVAPIEQILGKLAELEVAADMSGTQPAGSSAAEPEAYSLFDPPAPAPGRSERIRESSGGESYAATPPAAKQPTPRSVKSRKPPAATPQAESSGGLPEPSAEEEDNPGNGPPVEAPAATTAAGIQDIMSVKAAIDRAAEANPHSSLFLQLAAAKLVAVNDSSVTLELSNEFDVRRFQRGDTLREAQCLLSQVLDRPLKIQLTSPSNDGDDAAAPAAQGPDVELPRSRTADLANEPIVQEVLSIFGGEVIEVTEEHAEHAAPESDEEAENDG